jgi:hypothetical protein
MKPLLLVLSILPLLAQESQTPAKPPAPTPAQTPAPTPEASPVPAAESWLTGTIDLGYRWRTDVAGSSDTYRSIVNLGSGPKLLGTEFTLTGAQNRGFDRIDVRAYGWGGEPYSTFHASARKAKLYDFSGDYRDLAYFNFLPSFADPLLARGIVLNQQSFDLRRRLGSFQLDLLPGRRFVPYLAYDRDSGSGTGAATFVGGGNEYAVPNRLRDLTSLYRGGVRIELQRLHATLEQGGTTFKDDQSLYQNGGKNLGGVSTPVLGQTLSLGSLLAAYGVRGASVYSKALLTASATSWLDVYGQFLYSQPDSTVNYQQTAAGNFFVTSQLLFYTSQQFLLSAQSKMPHTTGSAGAEVRPHRNLRILQSWMTDRLHNSGAAASSQLLAGAGFSQAGAAQLTSSLITNYNQVETNVIWDALSRLTVRGGYRHVWGDAAEVTLPPAGVASADAGKLRRDVVIGGLTFRPWRKLTFTGEAEGAPDNSAYFRGSLHEYQKARAQVRYQAAAALRITADINFLNNRNPAQGVNYDYRVRQESLSLLWSPAGGKTFNVQGSYSRSAVHSEIMFFSPQDLLPQASIFRENGHTATGLLTVILPHAGRIAPKITAGGSFFLSAGNRATDYYQPAAKLWLPAGKNLDWFAEWSYYGYGEALYQYEGFRTHLFTAGVRIKR